VISASVRKEMKKVGSRQQKKMWASKVPRAWTWGKHQYSRGDEDVRVGTGLEFGGYSFVKKLILGAGHEPGYCGHTTGGDSSLSG
jgi:hypothetical protein